MKRVLSVFVGIVAIFALSQTASAQLPFSNVQQQQTVSPYLNLLNRQGTGLPNYQTLVRPQLQTDQNFARQQSQIQRLQRQQAGLASGVGNLGAPRGVSMQIRGTGQVSHNRFMETSHYFPVRQ
jgi:hypothetical protein